MIFTNTAGQNFHFTSGQLTLSAAQKPKQTATPAARTGAQTDGPLRIEQGIATYITYGISIAWTILVWIAIFLLIRRYIYRPIRGLFKAAPTVAEYSKETEFGSARWADANDMACNLEAPPVQLAPGEMSVGFYLYKKWRKLIQKEFVLRRNEVLSHCLILGPSGSGKSTKLFIPNLISAGNSSFLCTDPKSELFDTVAPSMLNAVRFVPSEPQLSAPFNPVPACKNPTISLKVAATIVFSLEKAGGSQPYWSQSEQLLLNGILQHVAHTDVPTLGHVYDLLNAGQQILIDTLAASGIKAAQQAAATLQSSPPQNVGSFILGLTGKLSFLGDPDVRRFTSSTSKTFDFGQLRREPTQIFWCLRQNEVARLKVLTTLFFNFAIDSLLANDGEIPVSFWLDEFANIGKLAEFEQNITLLRGQGIALIAGLQSKSQLEMIYGRDEAKVIFENFNNKIILPGISGQTAKEISELLGRTTLEDIRDSQSYQEKPGLLGHAQTGRSESFRYHNSGRDLLTADEIRRLPSDKLILVSRNNLPARLFSFFIAASSSGVATLNQVCSGEIPAPNYLGASAPPPASLLRPGDPQADLEIKPPKLPDFRDFEMPSWDDLEK